MPNFNNGDGLFDVIDFVNHPVVPDAYPPAFPFAKFIASLWSGGVADCGNFSFQGIVDWGVQSGKLFFCV
jgi:hypothetical protein